MNKNSLSSRSRLFNGILKLICSGQVKEPFAVSMVSSVLGTSTPFLSKHSIDHNDPIKKATGNPYFVGVSKGRYKINQQFRKCPQQGVCYYGGATNRTLAIYVNHYQD